MRGFIPANKAIAFYNLKELQQPLIERLCFFSEVRFHFIRNLLYRSPAVNQRPDKASHFIQMNIRNARFLRDFLQDRIHHALIFRA